MRAWNATILLLISLKVIASSLLVPVQQVQPLLIGKTPKDDQAIDTSLYSRQLFVYGESAQLALKHSTILIVGSGMLSNEVLKNIALTGVGKIVFANWDEGDANTCKQPSIVGTYHSAAEYATELNRNVKVRKSEGSRSYHIIADS